MENIIIRIPFTINQKGKSFSDSLNFTQEEYNNLSSNEIESMKQSRFDAWYEFITNPPIAQEPSKEDLISEKELLLSKIDDIDLKIMEIDNGS